MPPLCNTPIDIYIYKIRQTKCCRYIVRDRYWFTLCDTLASCKNCVDDSFYMDTVFASEFGWIGLFLSLSLSLSLCLSVSLSLVYLLTLSVRNAKPGVALSVFERRAGRLHHDVAGDGGPAESCVTSLCVRARV